MRTAIQDLSFEHMRTKKNDICGSEQDDVIRRLRGIIFTYTKDTISQTKKQGQKKKQD